ncbi:hypothetical protein N7517_011369 [Penicillium concentricum]|uniref:Uncharacterized protein n=1 Tax=Penicillium concentricum TaxID=293559 RepID=A0A9W9RC08_9EURO|nr:uncharacterized protein N7517_011369 [Penicillium concentricum]KAJ5356760.1 hypothetical protein N7517_011369 [Penicillium concentricum]
MDAGEQPPLRPGAIGPNHARNRKKEAKKRKREEAEAGEKEGALEAQIPARRHELQADILLPLLQCQVDAAIAPVNVPSRSSSLFCQRGVRFRRTISLPMILGCFPVPLVLFLKSDVPRHRWDDLTIKASKRARLMDHEESVAAWHGAMHNFRATCEHAISEAKLPNGFVQSLGIL